MEYISSAGIAWLARHNLTIDRMLDRWKQGRPVTPQANELRRYGHPDEIDDPDGDIELRKNFWRTCQDYGRLNYRELGSGHAKLRIANCRLPKTLLITPRTPINLDAILQIPPQSIAKVVAGKVIRIVNRPDNSSELLMRIEWHSITTAWMLERL